jgi:hypothetical protein
MSARSAATAVGFGERRERARTQLLDFRPMRKGKLLGFARVQLPIGLRINDIPILAGRNGAFAALPAKPQIDSEGRVKRDGRGKALYVPVLESFQPIQRYRRCAGPRGAPQRPRWGRAVTGMLAAHFRCERAIAAARRFISRNVNATLRRSDVVEFLRRRRDPLSAADIEYCANEAMDRQLASRANRYRPNRARKRATAPSPPDDAGGVA